MRPDAPDAFLAAGSFDAIPGWSALDAGEVLDTLRHAACHRDALVAARATAGQDEHLGARLDRALAALAQAEPGEARALIERLFVPVALVPAGGGAGFLTAYYEPEFDASRERTDRFRVPLLARPADLVGLTASDRVPLADGPLAGLTHARATPDGPREHPDRAAIETGALDGQGLELAWLEDPVDAFLAHVQGSVRLRFTDGSALRLVYAGKSGHPYTSVGAVVADRAGLPRSTMTMPVMRRWLREHPEAGREAMRANRSYVFFAPAPTSDPALGPVAAAGVPLLAHRSVALDQQLHVYGAPVLLRPREALPGEALSGEAGPRTRLAVNLDTGSAIRGLARADLFAGTGETAGEWAGVIRHATDFHLLLPRE